MLMANEVLWGLVNTLIRVTAVLLITRLFCLFNGLLIYSAYGLIMMSILHGLAILFNVLLICRPLASAWNNSIEGSCGNQVLSFVLIESVGAFIDLAILAPPPLLICRMPMGWKTKLLYSSQLSVGALFVFLAQVLDTV